MAVLVPCQWRGSRLDFDGSSNVKASVGSAFVSLGALAKDATSAFLGLFSRLH